MNYQEYIKRIIEAGNVELGELLKKGIEEKLRQNQEIEEAIALDKQKLAQNLALEKEVNELIKADKDVAIALEYLVELMERVRGDHALFLLLCSYCNLEGSIAERIADEIKTRLQTRRKLYQNIQKTTSETETKR